MNSQLDNIKMVFLDIDGTIYNSKKEITEYTKRILGKLKERGIHAVLCSGRTNISVCNLSKEMNASKYVIVDNGAFVYDYEEDKVIFESTVDFEIIKYFWDYCEKENIQLLFNCKNRRYGNKIAVDIEDAEKKEIKDIEEIKYIKVFQLVLETIGETTEQINKLLKNDNTIWAVNYGNTNNENKYFFDINNSGIDKGIGIKNLIENLGIKKEETICFGDGVNDYSMFRECGVSVAMGNAEEELKRMADYVTLTNDEDGVAKFIERYILKEKE